MLIFITAKKKAFIFICGSYVIITRDITATNEYKYHKQAWLGSRVVSVLDSGAEGPRLKSQS